MSKRELEDLLRGSGRPRRRQRTVSPPVFEPGLIDRLPADIYADMRLQTGLVDAGERRRRDIEKMLHSGWLKSTSGPAPLVARVLAEAIADHFSNRDVQTVFLYGISGNLGGVEITHQRNGFWVSGQRGEDLKAMVAREFLKNEEYATLYPFVVIDETREPHSKYLIDPVYIDRKVSGFLTNVTHIPVITDPHPLAFQRDMYPRKIDLIAKKIAKACQALFNKEWIEGAITMTSTDGSIVFSGMANAADAIRQSVHTSLKERNKTEPLELIFSFAPEKVYQLYSVLMRSSISWRLQLQ